MCLPKIFSKGLVGTVLTQAKKSPASLGVLPSLLDKPKTPAPTPDPNLNPSALSQPAAAPPATNYAAAPDIYGDGGNSIIKDKTVKSKTAESVW